MPRKPAVRGNLPTHASNIRRLLREQEMTHVAFANRIGRSVSSVYAALNGGDVRLSTLLLMAKALNVELWELLKPDVKVKPEPTQAPAQVPAQVNPLLALLAGLAQTTQPQASVPTAAQEFISMWSHLNSRQMAALIEFARKLHGNPVVDATYKHSH